MISLDQKSFELFIDNAWTKASSGSTFEVHDPSDGSVLGHVATASPDDVDTAVASARASFDEGWGALEPYKRGRLLEKWAQALWQHRDAIAEIETRNQGKPLREARADVAFAIQTVEYYAGLADKIEGANIPVPGERFNFTRREPLGVTAHVSPWNYPFQLAMRSIAPALAAGNTAILKPASWTPLSSLAMAETAAEAGLPAGTLNVVPGSGSVAGKALVSHTDVDALAFTGSYDTGVEVGAAAIERVIPVTLELGGKSPNVVFEDADLDAAAKGALFGAFLNAGQMCWAGSRLLVQASVAEEVLAKVKAGAEKLKIGPGMEKDTRMGPLVSPSHLESVEGYLGVADKEGCTVLTGGKRPDGVPEGGSYLEPTILTDVPAHGRIAQEEIFGPVLSVFTFEDDAEALALANNSQYGLYAGVWTRDLGRALSMSRGIEAGMVSVNAYPLTFPQSPFGGFKNSGLGSEQGQEAILHYTRLKNVFLNW